MEIVPYKTHYYIFNSFFIFNKEIFYPVLFKRLIILSFFKIQIKFLFPCYIIHKDEDFLNLILANYKSANCILNTIKSKEVKKVKIFISSYEYEWRLFYKRKVYNLTDLLTLLNN